MKLILNNLLLNTINDSDQQFQCVWFPHHHHQAILRHQLGILPLNSVLTRPTRYCIIFHRLRTQSYRPVLPPFLAPTASPGVKGSQDTLLGLDYFAILAHKAQRKSILTTLPAYYKRI